MEYFPIASGVIEGFCRHLIKGLLDNSGARWSLIGRKSIQKPELPNSSGNINGDYPHHF